MNKICYKAFIIFCNTNIINIVVFATLNAMHVPNQMSAKQNQNWRMVRSRISPIEIPIFRPRLPENPKYSESRSADFNNSKKAEAKEIEKRKRCGIFMCCLKKK